jgi:hypothetical protein
VGPFTVSGYTLDRWYQSIVNGTLGTTRIALADADRTAIGDEAATYAMQCVVVGGAPVASVTAIQMPLEGVRPTAGKTLTISFWARAASGTPKIGVSFSQFFGTGGSPSASVNPAGSAVTISTTWARYTVTLACPSIIGKVLGTNGDDQNDVTFWFSSGTTNNTQAGGIGVQSGTFSLWGMQNEVGSVATPLEKPDPQQDLAKCQRFYCTFAVLVPAAANPSNIVLPVTMRANPAVAGGGAGFTTSNLSAAAVTISQTAAAAQTLTFTSDF